MMPLTMCKAGEENEIKKIGGKEETRRHLENLGFVVGGKVAVISETDGNMIVNVKEARVAIGKDMAKHLLINDDNLRSNSNLHLMWILNNLIGRFAESIQ